MKKSPFISASTRDETPPLHPRIFILATQAMNQASALAVMVNTYVALERMITHQPCDGAEDRAGSIVRADLGALMRALNGEMERQVDSLVRHTGALHELASGEAGLR